MPPSRAPVSDSETNMIIASWFVFLLGVAMTAWVIFIKTRGALHYWIRPFQTRPTLALGRTFPAETANEITSQFLTDLNAHVRTLEQGACNIIREWDHEAGTLFIGLLLDKEPSETGLEGYELKRLPKQSVIRVSGSNKTEDLSPIQAGIDYAKNNKLTLNKGRLVRLSAQSFSLYQWEIKEEAPASSPLARLSEWTLQLRDISLIATLLVIITLGLLGTRQAILFPIGVGLIVFLSGACKFGFLHQRRDETQEVHLQNY